MMMFVFALDNLRVLFHGDAIFCVRARGVIIAIRDEKRFSSFRWVGVCGGVFRKTGDIHNMAETIFYATFLLFHFYMLCLIASLTVDYYCLICVVFCSSVFVA